jgi:glycosyltransferase involved in cell wall biosynthesis
MLWDIMASALAHQKSGRRVEAEALYQEALAIQPDQPDCLHMLGVIYLETGRTYEAFDAIYRALSLTGWHIEAMRHNMGLVLARLLAGDDAAHDMRRQYLEYCQQRDAKRIDTDPLVSIVIPSYNHGRWIQQALESVYAQTYRNLELIVIDDGSADGSVEIIHEHLAACPFPYRFIARENRGAHATINEGVALAAGEYVNVLNSDDWFPSNRISAMVEGIARREADWGFGEVSFVDGTGKSINPTENPRVFEFKKSMKQRFKWETLGAALLDFNHLISTGNLFVRKSFFDELNGFRDYRYNHDWDFCLRATLRSEPVFVPGSAYVYRLHESNTITETSTNQRPAEEAAELFSRYISMVMDDFEPSNRYAPSPKIWGSRFFHWLIQAGNAKLLPIEILQESADFIRNSLLWGPSSSTLEMTGTEGENKANAIKADIELADIPADFDPTIYLSLNPDIAAAGLDATTHYIEHGRQEGRPYSLDAIHIPANNDTIANRETILLVSHEASRTGAPILCLNLAKALVERYDVVVLLLGGGPLTDAFKHTGATVVTSSNLKGNRTLATVAITQLCQRFHFTFALVNSIESRAVLSPLSSNFVPTISLIHEFAAYTRPRDAFIEAILWSSSIIFSTAITKENAISQHSNLGEWSASILPQGRCIAALEDLDEEQVRTECKRLRHLMRPIPAAEDSVIILGAGTVQLRKGVELFIECAAQVVKSPQGKKCRFVWIGKGYDPENDVGYSAYLEDQIHRSGLQEHVLFIDETFAIDAAYEEADLLLLSSRLDPLPNVAIDAMAHGVPVLCFDKTTGIAEFLSASSLGSHCVAEYLDTADMAKKILALASSPGLRKRIGDRCLEASATYFSMRRYVSCLEDIAHGSFHGTQQEKEDSLTILDSGIFRSDFFRPLHSQGDSAEQDVRAYVRAWASGISRRKPAPGFHPGIYREQHGVAHPGADPFADYLRAELPEGSWNYPVIPAEQPREKSLPASSQIALHIHAYYPELLPEIVSRLSRNRIRPDLFVSVAREDVRSLVVDHLSSYRGKVMEIQVTPNRGRDIGPLVTEFLPRLLKHYDFVGHIHTKKSVSVTDASMGKHWNRFLLENLLGGQSPVMADCILSHMMEDPSLGMAFPEDPYIVGWGANRSIAETLAARMGLGQLPGHFNFPVGTMFWARTAALMPLTNLNLGWEDYPEEPVPYDGTMLHALERLFGLVVESAGFRYAVTNVKGITR